MDFKNKTINRMKTKLKLNLAIRVYPSGRFYFCAILGIISVH